MKLATGAGLDRCYKSAMFLALPGLLGARNSSCFSRKITVYHTIIYLMVY